MALESQNSSQVSAQSNDLLAPAQVTGLAFNVVQGKVNLSWNAVTTSALVNNQFAGDGVKTAFTLQYPSVADGSYKVTVNGVTQVENTGTGGDFTIDKVNGVITFAVAPAAPTTAGTNNIAVDYRQVLSDLSGYRVFRKRPADASFALINTVASTTTAQTTAFADTGMKDGASYEYAIAAIDDEATPNEGMKSASLGVKTIPSVPSGLVSSAFDKKIRLNWSSVKDSAIPEKNENLQGYNVYRSTVDGSGYAKIGSAASTETSFEDTSVVNGTIYYYVITSFDNSL